MKLNRTLLYPVAVSLIVLGSLSTSGCVVHPAGGAGYVSGGAYYDNGPRPDRVWVAGYYGPNGVWRPGHWRRR